MCINSTQVAFMQADYLLTKIHKLMKKGYSLDEAIDILNLTQADIDLIESTFGF